MNPTVDMSDMTVVSEPMGPTMEESFRRQQGSLPLKKRKLYHAFLDYCPPAGASNVASVNDTDKFAALALVAAANSTLDSDAASFPGLFLAPPSAVEHDPYQRMLFIHDESGRESVSSNSSSDHNEPSLVSPGGTAKSLRARVHHPPLQAPLPGGCHGRTSRNNSYCRRHPCYNGSKYCKIHYQHYVVAGMRDSAGAETAVEVADSSSGRTTPNLIAHQDKRYAGYPDEERCLATTTRGRACAYISVNNTKYCYLHADYESNPPPRRGGIGTGVRGARHLSSSESGDETASKTSEASSRSRMKSPVPTQSTDTSGALLKTPSPPCVTSEDSAALVTPQGCRSVSGGRRNKTKEAPPRDGLPLLSSISSDQWFDKVVMVSTGPLKNRTGRVAKWGNGWVSVRISNGTGQAAEGLLHNRRSVELYLLPEGKESVYTAAAAAAPETTTLARCVSQETDASARSTSPVESTAPTTEVKPSGVESTVSAAVIEAKPSENKTTEDGSEKKTLEAAAVIADVVKTSESGVGDGVVNSSESGVGDGDASSVAEMKEVTHPVIEPKTKDVTEDEKKPEPKVDTAPDETSANPAESKNDGIPEDEKNPALEVDTVPLETSANPVKSESDVVPEGGEKPAPNDADPAQSPADSFKSCRSVSSQEGKSLPLVESLMLAQEGHRKPNLGLLFGTAALERSRRTYSKPTRYEDTAMLVKPRSRQSSDSDACRSGCASPRSPKKTTPKLKKI